MKIDFRIDWGYQYLYSRRHYHPVFRWDGYISCDNGEITEVYKLDYPIIWYGIGHSPKETRLDEPKWQSATKRKLEGIRVVADVDKEAVFTLVTHSGTFEFKALDVIENGRIEFPVGPKYLGCFVTVTKTDFLWFRIDGEKDQMVINYSDLNIPVYNWSRMKLAWLEAGKSVSWTAEIPEAKADYTETVFHLEAMAAPEYSKDECQVDTYIPIEILCDGEVLVSFRHYFRKHDAVIEILDDVWRTAHVEPGIHTFEIRNKHENVFLLISRIIMTQRVRSHGQLSVPAWALKNEKIIGKVFAAKNDCIEIEYPFEKYKIDCRPGWNEFIITPGDAGIFEFKTIADTASIEVFDEQEERYPVKVGCDMTQIAHDDTGEMDWLLDYIQRTRLGNYVLFRSFTTPNVDEDLLYKWGEYCRKHGIYVGAATNYLDGSLAKGAAEMFNDCGRHEYSYPVYALDPKEPYASEDMKEASEKFIEWMKDEVDKIHQVHETAAFGDASGGIRYSYLAGASFVRAETMVGPTMPLLGSARAASEALSDGRWGVHIAIQHCYYPYRYTHLGQYFLSLMQPWMMGAEVIYEEDSLFGMWSEERQCWNDLLVKRKRDMTREFFKFAKTHPRKGKNIRNIAFLEGRYAAPFNGFICDTEQDPHYSVWGLFGNNSEQWGHCQPEKCRQVLDVLMPGTSTHPLRQQVDKRRFFFSGTPYGDFDCVPAEASVEYFNQYKLLLNLGWNTMIEEDYEKIRAFVENGGILLTGLPSMSRHTKRDFLKDMSDLNLWNDGDLRELCGIVVNGASKEYSGQWNCAYREKMPDPILSAAPSDSICEDGTGRLADITLDDAEVVAWDYTDGQPMLVRKKIGKGYVYTFTVWAYPGHEAFQKFSAVWVAKLAEETMPEICVKGNTDEVFWTRWEDGGKNILMLLNTDWTTRGNEKKISVIYNEKSLDISIKEGEATIVEIEDGKAVYTSYGFKY